MRAGRQRIRVAVGKHGSREAGLLAARAGDWARAESVLRELAADRRPYAYGRGTLWRARIEAALGDDGEALALLRSGWRRGWRWIRRSST